MVASLTAKVSREVVLRTLREEMGPTSKCHCNGDEYLAEREVHYYPIRELLSGWPISDPTCGPFPAMLVPRRPEVVGGVGSDTPQWARRHDDGDGDDKRLEAAPRSRTSMASRLYNNRARYETMRSSQARASQLSQLPRSAAESRQSATNKAMYC